MDPMKRKILEVLTDVLCGVLGDKQGGERRTRYALFLPVYRGLDGKMTDNLKAWWIEEKGKPRQLGGGCEILSGGIGQDCIKFHVGQVTEIPEGKGGDRIIQYITETPEMACKFILFTAPTPASAAAEINASDAVLHLTQEQHALMLKECGASLDTWKKRRDLIQSGVKVQKKGKQAKAA